MTTYRLPDGTEIALLDINESANNKAWVTHPVLGQILIDRDRLTEVKPPLPPEPPDRSVCASGSSVWHRLDAPDDPEGRWWTTGNDTFHRWEWVARFATNGEWRRLVPDPADDAPELPWKGFDDEDDSIEVIPNRTTVKLRISYGDGNSGKYVLLKPGVAQEAAQALLRAAQEAEQR